MRPHRWCIIFNTQDLETFKTLIKLVIHSYFIPLFISSYIHVFFLSLIRSVLGSPLHSFTNSFLSSRFQTLINVGLNVILADEPNVGHVAMGDTLQVPLPPTSHLHSNRIIAPPDFCSAAVKLTAMQMQALGVGNPLIRGSFPASIALRPVHT